MAYYDATFASMGAKQWHKASTALGSDYCYVYGLTEDENDSVTGVIKTSLAG